MTLTANQIPLHEWPNVAAAYMAVRILLHSPEKCMGANGAMDEHRAGVAHVVILLEYPILNNVKDLVRLREYFCDLLLECEEELQ